MQVKKFIVSSLSAALLAAGIAGTASAQTTTVGDNLVNVAVGDVRILEDVNVAVAADIVAQACGISVDAALGIIADVDNGDVKKATVCKNEDGRVKITQNND